MCCFFLTSYSQFPCYPCVWIWWEWWQFPPYHPAVRPRLETYHVLIQNCQSIVPVIGRWREWGRLRVGRREGGREYLVYCVQVGILIGQSWFIGTFHPKGVMRIRNVGCSIMNIMWDYSWQFGTILDNLGFSLVLASLILHVAWTSFVDEF